MECNLKNLEILKSYCEENLVSIACGGLECDDKIVIRFIDPNCKFGYSAFGDFFWWKHALYVITDNENLFEYRDESLINDEEDVLKLINLRGLFIVAVEFAGFYTGFCDDFGKDVYTGDIVGVDIITNPEHPSRGGSERVPYNPFEFEEDYKYYAGVNIMDEYLLIVLDNCSVPLAWATRMKIVGNVFYELEKTDFPPTIQSRCARFAQIRGDMKEELELASYAPFYGKLDWQKVALRLLGVDEN